MRHSLTDGRIGKAATRSGTVQLSQGVNGDAHVSHTVGEMSSSEVDDASGDPAVQDDTGSTLKEGSGGLGVGIFLSFSCVISLCELSSASDYTSGLISRPPDLCLHLFQPHFRGHL